MVERFVYEIWRLVRLVDEKLSLSDIVPSLETWGRLLADYDFKLGFSEMVERTYRPSTYAESYARLTRRRLQSTVIRPFSRGLKLVALARAQLVGCNYPVSVDVYDGSCEYMCRYCFAINYAQANIRMRYDGVPPFPIKIASRRAIQRLFMGEPPQGVRNKAEVRGVFRYRAAVKFGVRSEMLQPLDKVFGVAKFFLRLAMDTGQPVILNTKSDLYTRPDYFRLLEGGNVLVIESVTAPPSLEEYARRIEPGAPPITRRLRAVKTLAETGLPVGVWVRPPLHFAVIRGYSSPRMIDELWHETLQAILDAIDPVRHVSFIGIHGINIEGFTGLSSDTFNLLICSHFARDDSMDGYSFVVKAKMAADVLREGVRPAISSATELGPLMGDCEGPLTNPYLEQRFKPVPFNANQFARMYLFEGRGAGEFTWRELISVARERARARYGYPELWNPNQLRSVETVFNGGKEFQKMIKCRAGLGPCDYNPSVLLREMNLFASVMYPFLEIAGYEYSRAEDRVYVRWRVCRTLEGCDNAVARYRLRLLEVLESL